MNVEEAIDILKNSVADYVIGEYCEKCADNKICNERNEDCYYQQAIDAVIIAYEKEKEKNKELNKLKGFEMLDIFNMGKQSSRQRIEFDYVDKEKIKAGIEEARKRYNDLHTKHLRDCGIAEQRELAKIEFGESLLKEE